MKTLTILLLFLAVRALAYDCSAQPNGQICSADMELNTAQCISGVCMYLSPPEFTGTGTISSGGGGTVTGSGTDFVNQINPGWTILAGGQTDTVSTITDATHLVTVEGFSPSLSAGTAYTLRPPIARWQSASGQPLNMIDGIGRSIIGTVSGGALLDVEPFADPPSVSSGNGIDARAGFFLDSQRGGATTDTAGTGGVGPTGVIKLGGGGAAPLTPGAGGELDIVGSFGGGATANGGTGAVGGALVVQAGQGGSAVASATNGTGAPLYLRPGPPGTGGTGGAYGVVHLVDTGGDVTVGGGTTAAKLKFLEPSGSGTNVSTFTAAAQAADINYTLPTAVATVANAPLLSTTGAALSWGTVAPAGAGACASGKAATTLTVNAAPTCSDVSGIGACSAGQAVTTINALAAPTCTAFSTGSSTDTFTNKTLDVEGTGNVITTVSKLWIPAASCNNATPAPNLDLPTSAAPTAACVTGTNIQKGVLQYADGADSSAQVMLFLPTDWTGNVDAKVLFTSADVTNAQTEKWTVATSCRTPTGGTGATDDRAFNTAQTLTYTLGASEVASALRSVSQTSVTMTNCVAGDLWHVKVGRDTTDTDTTTMNLVGLELTLRRAQ